MAPQDWEQRDHRQREHNQSIDRLLGEMSQKITGCEQAINQLERTVDHIRDRVPPWIVWVMTGMGGLIGSLITLVSGK